MRLSSGERPGRIQSCGSWRGAVPASFARAIAAQSRSGAALWRSSATTARAALDAPPCQRRRVEQLRQLRRRQLRHLPGHLADGPALGVCSLGDGGTLLVSNDGIQGRHQDRVAIERLGDAGRVHLETGDGAIGEQARYAGEQCDALEQIVRDDRQHDIQLEIADCPATVIAASLPMTCAATMVTASGITGFTFPGMMLLPACNAGSEISPKPASGALFIIRRSLAIFIRLTAITLSCPESSTAVSCDERASK